MHQKFLGLTVAVASVAATLVIGGVAGAAAPSAPTGTVVAAAHHTATSAGKPAKRAPAKHRATPKSSAAQPTAGTSSASSRWSRLKPVLTGVLNRAGVPPAAYRSAEGGYDIQGTQDDQGNRDVGDVSWAELQPTAGGPIAANNAIDLAVADVRAWNAANPTHPEALKLRVEAGIHSPSWALDLGGACVAVTDPTSGLSGCCPRFWTAAFTAAYYQFEAELAARYDAVPEIREVDMAKNTTIYNESLIRQVQSPVTVAALLAAGYSTAVDEQQQLQDITSLGSSWRHTHVGFAFNPYQTANPVTQDEAFTQQLISAGRAALGNHLVVENNSLRQGYLTGNGDYQAMYSYMCGVGGPMGFQTATISKVGSIQAVLDGAIAWGAASLELPTGYPSQLTPDQLIGFEPLFK